MNVWQGLAERYGVLYPMQTFSKLRQVDFREVTFFTEAHTAADLKLLNEIALHLGSKVYEASSEQRRYLHIAAVFAATLPITCMPLPVICFQQTVFPSKPCFR